MEKKDILASGVRGVRGNMVNPLNSKPEVNNHLYDSLWYKGQLPYMCIPTTPSLLFCKVLHHLHPLVLGMCRAVGLTFELVSFFA